MDINQIAKMIEWLDEERRNDKQTIATLEERLAQQSETMATLQKRVNSVESDQTVIQGSSGALENQGDFFVPNRRDFRYAMRA